MTGTIVNTLAIVVGGSAGLMFRKNLPEKYETVFFQSAGLFTLLLGVRMSFDMFDISSPLLILLSLILGGFAGVKMNLAGKIDRFGECLKAKTKSGNERFTEGLTTGILLFCTGSMGIVGAVEEGFGKAPELLLAKSALDFFSALMLSAGLGAGVIYSALPLLVYQGGITLLVSLAGTSIPDEMIAGVAATGGIILIGLGLNLLRIKKMEIIHLLPALLLICLFIWLKMIFKLPL
ncbi:MAG: DUF554 domain-containing protein [Tannerella sp.]|jgi:uncharacterized membrane protein YqgA involved in biofilm formation|nr:DUF554 domain-containing protein [Tannerella sp.]